MGKRRCEVGPGKKDIKGSRGYDRWLRGVRRLVGSIVLVNHLGGCVEKIERDTQKPETTDCNSHLEGARHYSDDPNLQKNSEACREGFTRALESEYAVDQPEKEAGSCPDYRSVRFESSSPAGKPAYPEIIETCGS